MTICEHGNERGNCDNVQCVFLPYPAANYEPIAHQSSHLRDFQFPDKVKPSVVAGALDEMYGQSSQSIEYGELTTEMIGKATREYLSSHSKGDSWEKIRTDAVSAMFDRDGLCGKIHSTTKLYADLDASVSKLLSERNAQNVIDQCADSFAAGAEAERARCIKAEDHLFEETILGDGYISASDREWEKIKEFMSVYHLRLRSLLSPNPPTE